MPPQVDGVRVRDDVPIPLSPLSTTISGPSGLHIYPGPREEFYSDSGQSGYSPSEAIRRESLPSPIRQGSISHQGNGSPTYDPHASDPQATGTAPYINQATRPTAYCQASTSQPITTQSNERRDSDLEYDPIANFRSSNAQVGNAATLGGQSRRRSTSIPMSLNTREINPPEIQRHNSNTQANDSGRNGSTAIGPIAELPTAVSSASASAASLKSPWLTRISSVTEPLVKRRSWIIWILFTLTTGLLIGLIVVLVLFFRAKYDNNEAFAPTPTTLPQSNSMPITDSSIGAADVVIGTYFSTAASGVLQTKLVYNDGKGNICVRTKSGTDWENVQCLEGANPRADTPLTVLDWLGGPSIYFITADNFLSGIDHMPLNDTWKFSSLKDQKRPTHKQSQLASVTWFNGTSSWLYYQDSNSQLREFGLDDYRDVAWRDGSIGPLGQALAGSGIGASRWWLLSDGTEVLEVFIQVSGGALHGRVYMEFVWTSDFYAVDGTPNTVSEGAALTSTVIHQTNSTMVLLAYVSSDGYLTVQSRGTANQTNTMFDAFSVPENIFQGDGGQTTGIAAFDSSGRPMIYFVKNDAIWELSAPDVVAANWTTFDVTSA